LSFWFSQPRAQRGSGPARLAAQGPPQDVPAAQEAVVEGDLEVLYEDWDTGARPLRQWHSDAGV